jgi:hypothetical protein
MSLFPTGEMLRTASKVERHEIEEEPIRQLYPPRKRSVRKYYLYRQPLLQKDWKPNSENSIPPNKGEWFFDDEFLSWDEAYLQAQENVEKGSWKIWKIEEVLDFSGR